MCQAVEALLETSEGDMRKAITTLQSAARLKGKEGVTKADVVEVAGVIVIPMSNYFSLWSSFYVQVPGAVK